MPVPSIPTAPRALLSLLLSCPLLPLVAQEPLPADRRAGAAAVDVAMCRQWLGTLASPGFEGRGTGQPGYEKAAAYVAAHFRELGLEARGDDGSYYQHVPWTDATVDATATFVEFRRGERTVRVPAERLSGSASVSLSVAGDVLLLVVPPPAEDGDARRMPEIPGLDAVDAEGRVVVALIRSEAKNSAAMQRFAVLQGLQGKNAAAVLFAQSDAATRGLRGRQGASRRTNPAAAGQARQPLDATFGGADLTALLALAEQDEKALQGDALALRLPVLARVEVAVASQPSPAMNVWAVLPGSDPKLAAEYVVIGSHLDHLGKRGETIYPGADDDGSGTTGVMAVARMFAANGQRPRRSVLFACFSGEERGLIGSRWFADNCPIPLGAIVGELQMDMIGRDEEENAEGNQGEQAEDNRNSLHLIGSQKLAPALHELCLRANGRAGFDLEYDEERMFGRSDHANFAQKGVPIAFFFTGLHRDYHKPSDTPDKIHYEKLLRVARYVYDIAFELATQPERPEIDPDLWRSYRGRSGGEPAAPLRPAAKPATTGAPDPAGEGREAGRGSR